MTRHTNMLLSVIGVLGLAGTGLAAPFVTSAPSGADMDEWCKTSTIPKKLSGCPKTPEDYQWLEDPSDDEKLDFSNKERRDEPTPDMLPRASEDLDLEKLCSSMGKTWNGKTGLFQFDCLDIPMDKILVPVVPEKRDVTSDEMREAPSHDDAPDFPDEERRDEQAAALLPRASDDVWEVFCKNAGGNSMFYPQCRRIEDNAKKLTNMDRRDAPVRNEATHFCETDEGKAAKYDGPCEREIVKRDVLVKRPLSDKMKIQAEKLERFCKTIKDDPAEAKRYKHHDALKRRCAELNK